LKTTTDYGLQLQAADKELKTAQASLLSMVADQSAFFSRAAQKLEQLENAQSDDRAAELKKPTESKSMDSKATKSTDCTGSDCDPKKDEDDLKSEIKQKPVALPVAAAPSKVEVDQKSAAKVDQKSAAKVELDPKSVQAIVAMGFAPADAKQALRQYGGSVVAASAVLNASVVPH